MIDIRILHTMAELEAAVDMQFAVWGLNPRNAVPSAIMHVFTLQGGLVLGAYQDHQMVGVLISLPARDDNNKWILWSHMAGVHPKYQGMGIGVALKRFQRDWALKNGYHRICWTVDPLQRGNAHFNFHLLGQDAALLSNTYHVDFYGEMDDDINRGIPSDRLEVQWLIDQPRIIIPHDPFAPLLLSVGDALQPVSAFSTANWDAPVCRVAIPRSLDAVRSTLSGGILQWRLALREALQAAMAHGYSIVGFHSSPDAAHYLLKRNGDT